MTPPRRQPRNTFAARLQALRLGRGLTQRDLAAEAKVDHTQVSRYEAGEAIPRPGVLIRLALALHTTLEYLRDGLTEEKAIAELEAKVGPIGIGDAVEYSPEEYARLLKACELTGVTMQTLVYQLMLEGMRERFLRDRDTLSKAFDVDEAIVSIDKKLEKFEPLSKRITAKKKVTGSKVTGRRK